MAQAKQPSSVKLLMGAIFSGEGILIKAKQRLSRKFGPIDFQSQTVPFNFTEYYQEEMGPGLWRQFFSFHRLIAPQQLTAVKLYANKLEQRFSAAGKRRINLDPGYICAAKLVLASCKDYAHRIYLGQGVFAEITLSFQDGAFRAQPWTYPDYQDPEHLKGFHLIRRAYLEQLRRQ
ncbi:MAG: DUF4416 family protein [Candidatus Omnitrophica bacterium]|nr:DUF4416 family protein [Candidatus Omnitrophota bacterium]